MRVSPLENFSSLHETSLIHELGWNINWPCKHFFMQFSFNLHTPLKIHSQAYLTLHIKDANSQPSAPNCCYNITHLTRWRLDISSYRSIDGYLKGLIRWHRCNYAKSKKKFLEYGCEISFIEEDWSEHAELVYQLYDNVAQRYQHKLYNLSFFQEIAKRPDYKLVCAWYEGKMIAVFVLQEELPTLHSVLAGLDYQHSSASYAYSWMHYALFDHAIAAEKYQNIDVGFNSDEAKKTIGFKPILSRIDIYSKGRMTRGILKMLSHFISATITSEAKLRLGLKK
jgi:Acetyltransferase (GNAT) domain